VIAFRRVFYVKVSRAHFLIFEISAEQNSIVSSVQVCVIVQIRVKILLQIGLDHR